MEKKVHNDKSYPFLSFELKSLGNNPPILSLGMLANKSRTVCPLPLLPGLKPPNLGRAVVVVVVGASLVLGLNLLIRLLVVLGGKVVVVVVTSTVEGRVVSWSCPVILRPSRCLNKSAKDLGLKVVVVRVVLGGNVRILKRLNRVLAVVVVGVSSVFEPFSNASNASWASFSLSCCWMRAQGSKLDCNRSSSSLMLTSDEVLDWDSELEVLDLLREVETETLTLGVSGAFSVVVEATGLKGPKGTRTNGLVVLANSPVDLEVGLNGVVVGLGLGLDVVVDVVEIGVGLVGINGTGGDP